MTAEFVKECAFCCIEFQVEQLEESIRDVEAANGSAGQLEQELSDLLHQLYQAGPCQHKRARDEEAILAWRSF